MLILGRDPSTKSKAPNPPFWGGPNLKYCDVVQNIMPILPYLTLYSLTSDVIPFPSLRGSPSLTGHFEKFEVIKGYSKFCALLLSLSALSIQRYVPLH